MQDELLPSIGKAIIGAGLIGLPFYYLGIPLILAYLIAGVLLGPQMGIGLIEDSKSIAHISEIGLVLLMFILGLEINLKKLLQTGKAVFVTGIVQIVVTSVLALLYFQFFYDSQNFELIYLAIVVTLSSTLIVVKILSDQMDLDSVPSRITLGILVIQDLFAVGFLALQPNLSDLELNSLFISFSKVLILVLSAWIFAKYILPMVFNKSGRQPELMLILALGWCFAACGFANYLNLSLEMGALVAGISIASFPYHVDIAAKIASLRDFFITLFFVSLGLQIPLPTFPVLKLSLLIVILIYISRFITIYPTLYKLKYANRASLLPTINLSQLSEFSLVLGTIGVSLGHIRPELLSAFIIAMVITSLLSSALIPRAHYIYTKINPFLNQIGFPDCVTPASQQNQNEENKIQPTTVILGFYKESSSLLFEIKAKLSSDQVEDILVVDFNPDAHKELKKQGYHCIYGDISSIDTLRSLNLSHAKMIICTIPDKILKGTTNLKLLNFLKQLSPNSCKILTSENTMSAKQLYAEGADYVFLPRIISATYLLSVIERLKINGPHSIKDEAQKFLENRHEIID